MRDHRIAGIVRYHLKNLLACCLTVFAVLTLVEPALAGGGWNSTAKAMKTALDRENLVGQVSIVSAVMIVALAAVAGSLFWQLRRRRRAALELERRCSELADELRQSAASTGKLVKDGIDDDFDEWKLSIAESDIAWFMLRGLPLREIAELRGTSERTVRQQAQAVYRKAGLDGRSDLAGRVLERFI
ncbi:helix-turn-helix transcriptional regulator [Sphingomonas bacterium]|uniref:helix-turn-helix transcriptional regulator n=1 Tax=Sphingomonas bacterium TaxID=1895847 RepID=UPI00260C2543|nr:helix-turn-helix transcriptional regulator [Sphingomonas bacterium]MDB5679493.1 transcriptional regulator, LuxR family [Sphingomonas bacterium]